mmetsp:Transcript_15980/g.37675  ORF Transcript_15980/g.37675 Transcript_15980/m.37675 type:complete len:162 (+) Transcript_15980:95-580(+)
MLFRKLWLRLATFAAALAHVRVEAAYSVAFYHGDRNCAPETKAMAMYGSSITRDFYGRCRYAETLRPNGSLLYHLAYNVFCNANGTVTLLDYKPSIGVQGCEEAAKADPRKDVAFAFALPGLANGDCVGADSPDGDPSGESWKVTFDEKACAASSVEAFAV